MAIERDCFVSVVAPLRNDEDCVDAFVAEVREALETNYENYEILLVDDGSTDTTPARVSDILRHYEHVRLIRLSRTFGDEIAICAGLESAIGDYVVTMIPISDPPDLIPAMVTDLRKHGGGTVGVRRERPEESFANRVGSRIFYWVCNRILDLNIPANSTQFRAMSRQALNALLQIKEKYRYLKVLSAYIGYQHTAFAYDPIARGGRRRERSLLESIDLTINAMVANSTHLLRTVTLLGLLASVLDLLYMGYILAVAVFKTHVAEGWITLSAQSAGMWFFLFVILTVFGEYLGRILAETQDRPLYYVLDERSSTAAPVKEQRRNIVTESKPYVE
jgi:glycosyltransferase involved in cell wall biosynthesis